MCTIRRSLSLVLYAETQLCNKTIKIVKGRTEMSFQKFFFVAIDKLFDRAQNKERRAEFRKKNMVIEKDIVYDDSNSAACTLDVYHIPKNEPQKDRTPVLLYVHGGGFEAGDKKYRRRIAHLCAAEGLFVVNVNYGLCPEYKWPEPHRHIVASFNWIGKNAEKYGLDLSRIMVSGDSAGAYYAAFLICITLSEQLQKQLGVQTRLKIHAAALVCGVYEVSVLLRGTHPADFSRALFKDIAGIEAEELDTYEWKNLCSVTEYVTADFPPTFISSSKYDILCPGQAEMLEEAFQKHGVYYEKYTATKFSDNHCFSINGNSKAARACNKMLADFIERFKKGKIH